MTGFDFDQFFTNTVPPRGSIDCKGTFSLNIDSLKNKLEDMRADKAAKDSRVNPNPSLDNIWWQVHFKDDNNETLGVAEFYYRPFSHEHLLHCQSLSTIAGINALSYLSYNIFKNMELPIHNHLLMILHFL